MRVSSSSSSCDYPLYFNENSLQKEIAENKTTSISQEIFKEMGEKNPHSATKVTINLNEAKDLYSLEQQAIDLLDKLIDFDKNLDENKKIETEKLIIKLTEKGSYVLATDLLRALTEKKLIPIMDSEKWFLNLIKAIIETLPKKKPEENIPLSLGEQVTENLFETTLNIKNEIDCKECPPILREAIHLLLTLDTALGLSDIRKELGYFISLESMKAEDTQYFSELLQQKQIKQALEILDTRISKKFYPIQDTLFFYYRLMQSIKSYQKDEIDPETISRLTECALQLKTLIAKNKSIEKADNNVDYLKGGIRILLTFLGETWEAKNELSKYVSLVDLPKFNEIKVYSKNIKLSSFQDWCEFWTSSEKLDKNKKQQWEKFVNENNIWSKWVAFALDKQKTKNQRFDLLLKNWKIALNHSNSFKNCNTLELFQSKKMEEFLLQCIPYPKELEGLYLQLFKESVNKLKLQSQDKNQVLSSKAPDAAVNLLLKHTLLFEKCKLYPIVSNLDIIEADLIYLLKNKFHSQTAIPFCHLFINHLTQKICHDFCEEYFWKFFSGQFSYTDAEKWALLKAAHAWCVFRSNPVHQQPKFYEYMDSLLTLGKEAYDEALFFAMQYIQSHPSEVPKVKKFYELIDHCSNQMLEQLKVWLKNTENSVGVKDFIKNSWWKITERELEEGITPLNIEIFEERACYFMENKRTYEKMHELARVHWKDLFFSNLSVEKFGENAMAIYKLFKPLCSSNNFPCVDFKETERDKIVTLIIDFISKIELLIKTNPNINIQSDSEKTYVETSNLASFLFHIVGHSIKKNKKILPENKIAFLCSELTNIIHLLSCETSYKIGLYKAYFEAIFLINSKKNDPLCCLEALKNPLFWRLYYLARLDISKGSLPDYLETIISSNEYDNLKGIIILSLALQGIEQINSPERFKLAVQSFKQDVFPSASQLQNLLTVIDTFDTVKFNDKIEKFNMAIDLFTSFAGNQLYNNLTKNLEHDQKSFKDVFSTFDTLTKNLTTQVINKLLTIIISVTRKALKKDLLTIEWLSLIDQAFNHLFWFKSWGLCDKDLVLQATDAMQKVCIDFLGESPDLKIKEKKLAFILCSHICEICNYSCVSFYDRFLIDENVQLLAVNHLRVLETCYTHNKDFLKEKNFPWSCLLQYISLVNYNKDKECIKLKEALESLILDLPNAIKQISRKAYHLAKTENVPILVELLKSLFNIFKLEFESNPKTLKYFVSLLFKFVDEDSQNIKESIALKDFLAKFHDKPMLGTESCKNSALIYDFVSDVFDYALNTCFPKLFKDCEKENNIFPAYRLLEYLTFFIHYFQIHNLYDINNFFYLNNIHRLNLIFSKIFDFLEKIDVSKDVWVDFANRYGNLMHNFSCEIKNPTEFYSQEQLNLLCEIFITYMKVTVRQSKKGEGAQDSYQQFQNITIKFLEGFILHIQKSRYSEKFKSALEALKTAVSSRMQK